MATTITITLPDVLVRDAQEAAAKYKTNLETFIVQAIFARVQELPSIKPFTPNDWPKERMAEDMVWVRENYQTLAKNYPDQWIYVYEKKVCGANRDMSKAEQQAKQVVGDVNRAGAVTLFVEGRDHYVF